MKPVWFLDVDGVINAVAMDSPTTWPNWQRKWIVAQNGRKYSIHYSPSLIDRIITLTEKVEIRWLTTWEHAAVENLAPALGLPEFVVAGRHVDHVEHEWWKFPILMAFVETNPDAPVIWTDDDIRYYKPAMQVARERSITKHMLAISPLSYVGLTPQHLDFIEEFADHHAERAA